jgi:arsenical pump membrane protein
VAGWAFGAVGVAAAVVAFGLAGPEARAASSQVWSPFVLVAGLLLVGLVADEDGLFASAGERLSRLAPSGVALFAGATAAIAVVTALLNLDTSVVFLTPVLVHAARGRGQDEAPLLIGCLLLSNAGSLLLPGSNLTNLIVLGQLHLSGAELFRRMVLPWLVAVVVTALVIAVAERRHLRHRGRRGPAPDGGHPVVIGLGTAAVIVVGALVLTLRSPALPVAGVGVLVVAVRLIDRREQVGRVLRVLGIPVLVGLFGIAVALGTLGRTWSGPATLLAHLDGVGAAVVAAGASVLLNNLPAASLLASRAPPHPYALLIGLDIGPNLFVTGSLAWILWWRTARATGSRPPVARAIVLGLITVPLAMAGALAMVAATGSL